jgi:protease IV
MASASTPPNDFVPAQLVESASRGPIRVVIQQPRYAWIGGVLKWALLIVLVLVVIGMFMEDSSPVVEQWHSLSKRATDKIAIIDIEGTIFGNEGFVKDQIDRVRDDDDVKAVVVRVDSPGGTVTGSDYIYHHLKKLAHDKEIPLVISMGGIAASGGYYVAMAAGDVENTIYAEPTTWTGSIGVIIPHYNVAKLLERWDIEDDSIASNPLKMMGSPTRAFPEPIRAEEQEILKGLVESSFDSFKEIVLASRPALRESKDKQEVVFTGRIFTAKQAQANLLVDRLGFIEDAIDRAIELASLDKENVQVVRYQRRAGAMELLLFGPQSRKPAIDLSSLVEMTVPKAYYLCTWMPALAGAARPARW